MHLIGHHLVVRHNHSAIYPVTWQIIFQLLTRIEWLAL